MRLLQIVPGTSIGGAERYALTIGAAAATEGWDVHAALAQEAAADLVDSFSVAGAATHSLASPAGGPPAREVAVAAQRTLKLLRRVRPDVVHVSLPFPTFARGNLAACALRGVPTVVVFQLVPDRFELGRGKRLYAVLRARGQVWVAVSEHGRVAMCRSFGVPVQEVNVIRNGVAPAPDGPLSEEERIEVRRALGLPDSAFVALSVGRLSEQKAHADIIPVAAAAAEHFPHVHFVIAGEGEERAVLEGLVRDHRLEATVHLVGQRDDADRLMGAADLFLLPSRFEGFPFALLEAAVHGLPIICADFGGAREIVTHRDSALLHRPGDTDSLRGWIEFAVERPEEMRAMGQRGKEAAARFSREEMIQSTLSLLSFQAALPTGRG